MNMFSLNNYCVNNWCIYMCPAMKESGTRMKLLAHPGYLVSKLYNDVWKCGHLKVTYDICHSLYPGFSFIV